MQEQTAPAAEREPIGAGDTNGWAGWRARGRAGCQSAIVALGVFAMMATPWATDAAARTVCRSAETAGRAAPPFEKTTVLPRVQLDRIDARELLGGERAARTVRSNSGLLPRPRHVQRMARRIPSLWQRRMPVDVALGEIKIEHRVLVRGMAVDAAQSQDDINARLPVVLRPTYPVEVCRRDGYKIVEGGVVLEFVTRGLPAAGQYRFQIETDVRVP